MRRFIWSVVLVLDALLALFFAVGYGARYLNPRYAWPAELVATGLPYLAMLLVPATLVLVLMRRWRWVGVYAVLLLLASIRFYPAGGAEASAEDLVVMTFNTSRGGGIRADVQQRAITAAVRAAEPHLIGFQEVHVEYHPTPPKVRPSEPVAALVDTLGYRTIGPDGSREVTYTPLPVLAQIELIEQTQTILHQNDADEPTGRVVRTHFRWQGREAVHYNLHLRSFGYDKPWDETTRDALSPGFWKEYLVQYRRAYRVRAQQAAQIRAMIDQETLPLIVSGDFNSTPHNSAYYRLSRGLQDAFKQAGSGWGATYHAEMPVVRIDHVLVSPAWEVVSARVTSAEHTDHRPLVARLRWRQ